MGSKYFWCFCSHQRISSEDSAISTASKRDEDGGKMQPKDQKIFYGIKISFEFQIPLQEHQNPLAIQKKQLELGICLPLPVPLLPA